MDFGELSRVVEPRRRCGRSSVFRLRITERGSEEAVLDLWDRF